MKQKLINGVVLSFIILITIEGIAQTTSAAKTESPTGFWVVESNLSTPRNHVVRFYTSNKILVYTEILNGVKLKLKKKKIRAKLIEVLETSIMAWQKKQVPEANKNYLVAKLRD